MTSVAPSFPKANSALSDSHSYLTPGDHILRGEAFGLDHLEQHARQLGSRLASGLSGWLCRVLIKDLLGMRHHGSRLRMQPCLPEDWPEFQITYRREGSTWRIRVVNEMSPGGSTHTTVDGQSSEGSEFETCDGWTESRRRGPLGWFVSGRPIH